MITFKSIQIVVFVLALAALFVLGCDDDDDGNNNETNDSDSATGDSDTGDGDTGDNDTGETKDTATTDDSTDKEYVPQPYVDTVGIGVCDLEASIAFYTDGMGMKLEGESDGPYYHEVRLSSPGDKGSSLILMDLDDDSEECGYYPDKVVFVVPDVEAARATVLEKGGSAAAEDILEYEVDRDGETVTARVAMMFDPDRYLVEMIEAPSASNKYLSGVGIGVSDLTEAKAFYVDVLGMELDYELQVPNLMDESILKSSREMGMEVVLMQYLPVFNKNYSDLPVKLVFSVSDAAQFENLIAEKDSSLIMDKPNYAKDIYGYLLEIVEE